MSDALEWLDQKIVTKDFRHGVNSVEYALFRGNCAPGPASPDVINELKISGIRNVCFSGMLGKLKRSVTKEKGAFNRMLYRLEIDSCTTVKLTADERVRWVRLSKQHAMLPEYIPDNAIVDLKEPIKAPESPGSFTVAQGYYVFDLNGLTQAQLYVYLSTLRYMREDPGLARVVLHLVEDGGLNYYAAFVFGSHIAIVDSGHHIIPASRRYGAVAVNCDFSAQLHLMNGLQRFVTDPLHFDSDSATNTTEYLFRCASIIDVVCTGTKHICRLKYAKNPFIVKAIMAKDDDSYTCNLNEFLNQIKVNNKVKGLSHGW